ncbi:MAG: hypothetical protein KDN22_31450 [Verrucomicrobiae bacterium]|nr:hypothetical protein [Verrucomicrobiae bacterium]
MSKGLKVFLSLICASVLAFVLIVGLFVVRGVSRFRNDHRSTTTQLQDAHRGEVTRAENRNRRASPQQLPSNFKPLSNLYDLGHRGCSDNDLSSLILQNALIKRDPRLAYEKLDIDRCNALVCAYVRRGVSLNKNYYLRQKLVESFGQSNQAALVNRMRLVAVLLGGEKGSGGIDPRFREIREEAHRFSPYVLVQIQEYADRLEQRMRDSGIKNQVPADFRNFVDALDVSRESEYSIANIGSRNRDEPAKELYALRTLYKDLSIYYGERAEESSGLSYEAIFTEPGSFQSEILGDLQRRHQSMSKLELAAGFSAVGVELREYLSSLRDRRSGDRGSDEEVNQIKRLNEIVAVATGLFAGGRDAMPPAAQARQLVDLLYLEGLYSKKQREGLLKELDAAGDLDNGREDAAGAFYSFLNYMNGLAYAKMDESLGGAARYYSGLTKEAENYLEIQARKSALQVLGLLQLDVYEKHRSILQGTRDIHLAGEARGKLMVFRSQNEITGFLRNDSLNGADTIWVLKSGLNMPNEASFAAMILEDPIMKASHYDGYARSRTPPIPLLQIPEAVDLYGRFHGKNVLLEAQKSPDEKVLVTEVKWPDVPEAPAVARQRWLDTPAGDGRLFLIDAALSNEEIREMQKHVGSKAANYAFLRSNLPLNPVENEEHIYPGFAIPFDYYEQHVTNSGIEGMIAGLSDDEGNSDQIRRLLVQIQERILQSPVDPGLLRLFRQQIEAGLGEKYKDDEGVVKLRLRSSSNAEDNAEFSGAGLYESHPAIYTLSGARGDYDIAEANQRAVAYAMKRVWASLWNAEAYFARQRAGIVQETVRMGILVHPSYRSEESTGVVFRYAANDIEIVVNKGKENVQNPRIAGLTPEMHRITDGPDQISHSSRYAISRKVILSEKDRGKLMGLIDSVVPKFQALYPEQGIAGVDVEFKMMEVPKSDGGKKDVAMLKQIRPLAKRPSAGDQR